MLHSVANMAKAHTSCVNFHTPHSVWSFGSILSASSRPHPYCYTVFTVNQLPLQSDQLLPGMAQTSSWFHAALSACLTLLMIHTTDNFLRRLAALNFPKQTAKQSCTLPKGRKPSSKTSCTTSYYMVKQRSAQKSIESPLLHATGPCYPMRKHWGPNCWVTPTMPPSAGPLHLTQLPSSSSAFPAMLDLQAGE